MRLHGYAREAIAMRCFIIPALGFCALSSACSILDEIEFGKAPQLDPGRIYLDERAVYLDRHTKLDSYGCVTGPLLCTAWGQQWKCNCP